MAVFLLSPEKKILIAPFEVTRFSDLIQMPKWACLTTKSLYLNTLYLIYLEADANYAIFHALNHKFIAPFHLKFFDAALKEHNDFLLINKTYILNLQYLKGLQWKSL